MASTLEIIRGLSQAIANTSYDGVQDSRYSFDGEERKMGLKREEGSPIVDSRVIDGFKCRFHGDILIISYQSEIKLKEVYSGNFEDEIESMINDISKFLKKEYKKVTGDTISLKPLDDADIIVQSVSRIRSWVQATKKYRIGGLGDVVSLDKQASKDTLRDNVKKFLELGRNTKRPSNDTRPKQKRPGLGERDV